MRHYRCSGPEKGKVTPEATPTVQLGGCFMQALVDGPCTGVKRQAISFNKLCLTDFKIRISRSAREKQLRKAYETADISTKWEQTAWARRIAKKARRKELTDFDRFKLRVLRQQASSCNAFSNPLE